MFLHFAWFAMWQAQPCSLHVPERAAQVGKLNHNAAEPVQQQSLSSSSSHCACYVLSVRIKPEEGAAVSSSELWRADTYTGPQSCHAASPRAAVHSICTHEVHCFSHTLIAQIHYAPW